MVTGSLRVAVAESEYMAVFDDDTTNANQGPYRRTLHTRFRAQEACRYWPLVLLWSGDGMVVKMRQGSDIRQTGGRMSLGRAFMGVSHC